MPILDTQPRRAFEKFETHIEEMVRSVLPLPQPVRLTLKWRERAGTDPAGVLEFTKGGIATSVPVDTKVGRLYLSLTQDVIALREGLRFRVRTKRYAYKLLPSDDPEAEAIIRWEFESDTDDGAECRNHLHVNTSFPAGHGTMILSRLHIPTAWVLIEHVLRFLFHDMQVAARTSDWPQILRDSETRFYEEFTSKRYRFR
jgi:hypothetical protein